MWQLLSHGSVLGTTGPELPVSGGTTRAWPLIPTPAFDSVRTLVASFEEMRPGVGSVPPKILAIAEESERTRAIQAWVRSNPEIRRRIELYQQFTALELRLVSDDGQPLRTSLIIVSQVPPPGVSWVTSMHDDFAEAGFPPGGPPFYIVVASVDA